MPRHSWASGLAAVLFAGILGGCSGGGAEVTDDAILTVYVSLPLRGADAADGRDAADGARLALSEAGNEAGGLAVEAKFLDDTEGAGEEARWTPAKAGANARAATEDSTAIAYLGEFDSGATRASLPVTNAARMLQVSPASSAGDLVAAFVGSDDVPETQPSGERTFGRVIPSDQAQAEAAAAWVERMGVREVSTLSDGTPFGDQLAEAFKDALRRASVTNVGAQLLFFGGEAPTIPASLAQSFAGTVMVSDAQLAPRDVALQAPGTLATSAALDPSQLGATGGEFVDRFADAFDRQPGRYAAYGYEAMALILDSIERSSDPADRSAVVDAFFESTERDSILGTYSIDELGETTLDRMTGYELRDGRAEPAAELDAGP